MFLEVFAQAQSSVSSSNLSNRDGGSIPLFILLVPIFLALFNIVMAYLGSLRYKKLKVVTKEHEWLLQQKANCLAYMRLKLSEPLEKIQAKLEEMQKAGSLTPANLKKLSESISVSKTRVENLSHELQRSTLHVTQEAIDIIPFYRSVTTMVVLAMTVFVITVVNSILASTKVVSFTFGMLLAQIGVFLLAAVVVLVTNRYKKVSDKLILHSKATLSLQQRMDDSKDHLISLVIKIISADITDLKQDIALLVDAKEQSKLQKELGKIDTIIERLELLNNVETRLLKSDVRILNIEDLVEDIFRTYQKELNERGVQVEHFHRVGSTKLQPSIVQDYSLLRLAFAEVFHNAVQHSPPRGLVKVVSEHSLTSSSLTISDQGPGIKLKHAKVKPFMGTTGTESQQESVGIGLYLADQIMHILGGEIQISNNKEGGASVKLVFINSYVR